MKTKLKSVVLFLMLSVGLFGQSAGDLHLLTVNPSADDVVVHWLNVPAGELAIPYKDNSVDINGHMKMAMLSSAFQIIGGRLYVDSTAVIGAPQAIRAQTNAGGLYTWTFPTPFGSGVIPVITSSVEGVATSSWDLSITAISNTSVTVQVTRSTPVTVLGISLLGVSASPQTYVHLVARAP